MDTEKPRPSRDRRTATDVLIKVMNCGLSCFKPKKGVNFRWANSERDAPAFRGQFRKGQMNKVYKRLSCKYKYHPQQQYENAVRKFDVTMALSFQMQRHGNIAFYRALTGSNEMSHLENQQVDLTTIAELNSVPASADYLYRELCSRKDEGAAQAARSSYVRGFSRVVNVRDYEDWTKFRTELRNGNHLGAGIDDSVGDDVILLALSYKGKSVHITRRMRMLNDDGTPSEYEGVLAQTEINITSDFVDDFRWSQIIRSCMAIAKCNTVTHLQATAFYTVTTVTLR